MVENEDPNNLEVYHIFALFLNNKFDLWLKSVSKYF